MNTPKIRFKGFKDDWEQRKFGELVNEIREKTKSENEDTLLSCAIDGMYLNSELFSHFRGSSNIGYLKVKKNDLILSAQNLHLGNCNVNLRFEHGIISPAYKVYELVDCNPLFIQAWVKQDSTKDFFLKASTEGASVCRKNIVWEELYEQTVSVPEIKEQEKIGYYFRSLDHLITLHQRKCDETKQLKKFMLQKMFPKNGEKNPEIRFEGFTDDWEQRKFSDCYKMSSGYAFKMSDYCDEGVGLINGESIQHGIINDDNLNHLPEFFIQQYPEFLLKENDIVVGLNRPITNGNLKIARIPSKYNDSLLYQRAGKIVYKTDCDKDFTYVLLSQEILKHTLVEAVGSDQPFISTSKLDGWKMMMPSNMEEQVKIGEYFQNLDDLITLHQRKCEKLKELKKFMLQNMFV